MEHPVRELRPLRQPRRDPLRGRPGPRRRAARRRGRGLPDRPAAAVPGPHPPLHALARGRRPRVRHALRARRCTAYSHGSMLAEHQTVQNWIADSEAEMPGGAADDAARGVEDGHRGRRGGPQGIAMIKFYGAKVLHDVVDRALQAHGGARLLDRPAARGDVPLRPGRAHLRRPRRGPPRVGRPPGAARLRAAGGRRPDRVHPGRGARRRAASSPPAGEARHAPTTEPRALTLARPTLDRRPRLRTMRQSRDDPARRAARLLRRRRPGRADGRARARALRRAGLRAQGDRPQQARGRAAARARRGVRRRPRPRCPRARPSSSPPMASPRACTRTRERASCTRSTRPARW